MNRAWLVALVVVCGCKDPVTHKKVEVVVNEDEFTSSHWEDLTEQLLISGRNGDVETFKGYVSDETRKMFEESWKPIIDKCDKGLAHEGITYEDRDKLIQIKDGCTWEALAKNYRPGRLITITPVEGGGYKVKEILPAGRKVDYLVTRDVGDWQITYASDARWFRQLEAVAHAIVNGVLEKYGLSDKPAGSCGAPPSGAEAPAVVNSGDEKPGAEIVGEKKPAGELDKSLEEGQ